MIRNDATEELHGENPHKTDVCGYYLSGGIVFRRSSQLGLWGRPMVRGDKHRHWHCVLGLPIPHVRSVLSECAGRQSRLLQRESVAGPPYYQHSGTPKTSKRIRATTLAVWPPPEDDCRRADWVSVSNFCFWHLADITSGPADVRFGVPAQPVDATPYLKRKKLSVW
jgi:hypothetical protein